MTINKTPPHTQTLVLASRLHALLCFIIEANLYDESVCFVFLVSCFFYESTIATLSPALTYNNNNNTLHHTHKPDLSAVAVRRLLVLLPPL